MKTISRRSLAAAALAAPALMRPAAAQGRSLTVASLLAADKPETLVWNRVRDLLQARMPGRFAFRIVPNAALGGEREVGEGLRLGSVQGSLMTLAALSGWVPETQVMEMPFVFRDRAHLSRALAGPVGEDLRAKLTEARFVPLGFVTYGARQLLTKEPVQRPSGVSGKRIRVIQSPLHTELWRSYGALPTPIPIPETYNALRSGVVDMMDLTIPATFGFRLHEVVPCITETSHIWAAGILAVSQAFWRGLTEEERRAFAEAGAEAARHFDALIVEEETTSLNAMRGAGARVFAAEDLPAWQAGARNVWTAMAPRLGGMARIEALAGA
jgi:tripartite ATP-independent transporter DctP family solute receptor